jgi:signal transduction histidine kinase
MSAAGILPFVLIAAALLASVAVPARQTWVITELLHQNREILEPSRLVDPRLQAGLADELEARDDKVRELERFSIASNAVLVFAALAGLLGVMVLTSRERRALSDARRRARQELALREAAEALAGAFTNEEVTQRIAQAALEALEGRGAFVEEIVEAINGPSQLVVRAVSGTGVPSLDSTCDLSGSYTEQVTESGNSTLIPDLTDPAHVCTATAKTDTSASAIVVPLGDPQKAKGALFVLSEPNGHFREQDVERAAIFGHLAALAYEKITLLEVAHEGRRKLETVLQSRSRLIRGFTHDVKNPVGAADGYAELLSEGIYGELSPEQRESIKRIRRCIHDALALIDDLNALARAQSGNMALTLESLDVVDLMRSLCEEYQAAAESSGLTLTVVSDPDIPVVQSSRARVRQIASNLLSNAIKYTDAGSVVIRARCRRSGPSEEPGNWVAVELIDTGRGIPLQKQEFIFEEFSRIDGDKKPGAGLGLAISRVLAEALGGHITVASDIGRGSTFTLWLPFHRGVEEVRQEDAGST